MENYSKAYARLFHYVPDSGHSPEYSGPAILPSEVRRMPGCLPSVHIHSIMDEGREGHRCNGYRLGVPTYRHHHLPLGKYVCDYLFNTLVCK